MALPTTILANDNMAGQRVGFTCGFIAVYVDKLIEKPMLRFLIVFGKAGKHSFEIIPSLEIKAGAVNAASIRKYCAQALIITAVHGAGILICQLPEWIAHPKDNTG